MGLHAALAAAATLLAVAFGFCTLERWLARHKKHELMWTISLAMFALGSLGLWAGATFGWGEWTFKTFYLFGAILNVPFLALGTVYLLCDERFADRCTAAVSLIAAFAAGIVVAAPFGTTLATKLGAAIDPTVLPQGSLVFGPGPRIAAAVGSGLASVVIIGGALWSAWRLAASTRISRRATLSDAATAEPPPPGQTNEVSPPLSPGRLALANVFIAVGTIVLGSGGVLNSIADAMNAFAISLVAGIALIFAGFLLTSTPAPIADVEPWYPPVPPTTESMNNPMYQLVDPSSARSDERRSLADAQPGSPHLN